MLDHADGTFPPSTRLTDRRHPMRLAVFASGGGTNFQAILDAIDVGTLPAEVACCVSNTPDAGALERSDRHDVPTDVIPPSSFEAPLPFGEALLNTLNAHDATFVALAGYMQKIPPNVVDEYRGRMTNIHPALLPAFGGKGMYGMHVHRAVLDYGVHWTGATVHLVDEEYDHGPVVLQEPVPVYADDTPDELADRVRDVEHRLYPEALRLFAENRVRRDGRTISIDDPEHRRRSAPPRKDNR
jgi:formyltetrahydrofolate-dependent phosphoribosylglycinamide formyltransferase